VATVLVVEDRPTDRELLVSLLGTSGYDVLEAEMGGEALRLTREWKPDVVIADMLVPEMDGLDLARAVRSDPAIAATPIILYTATHEQWELERLGRAAGVSLVLPKPADPHEILAAVASLLSADGSSST
jgi:CheY-like chemotaxis protein